MIISSIQSISLSMKRSFSKNINLFHRYNIAWKCFSLIFKVKKTHFIHIDKKQQLFNNGIFKKFLSIAGRIDFTCKT